MSLALMPPEYAAASSGETAEESQVSIPAAHWNVTGTPGCERPADEAELLRRIAHGDRDAFSALYDCYATPLYSLAVRMLGEPRAAEDVLQEVFLCIWQRASVFDSARGKPFHWVVTLTRNEAIDHIRHRQRFRRFEAAAEESSSAETSCLMQCESLSVRDEATRVSAAVQMLPAEQKQCIELAFFSGLRHREIAAKLAVPLGTVKARIRRGMLRLRKDLAAWL